MTPAPFQIRPLYLAWLAALAICLLFFLWAFFALGPTRSDPPRRAPEGSIKESAIPREHLILRIDPELRPLPPFDPDSSPRLITAFSLSGLHLMDGALPFFSIREPGSRFAAQVIARDPSPKILLGEVEVDWQLQDIWTGAANRSALRQGRLAPDADERALISEAIPLLPMVTADPEAVPQSARPGAFFAPYPTLLVRAGDAAGADSLAAAESGDRAGLEDQGRSQEEKAERSKACATRLVLPVSMEMACNACHDKGGPGEEPVSLGMDRATAMDILRVHDKRNNTRLEKAAGEKGPVDCHACHAGGDAPLKAGDPPNLSAAMHGFHAAMRPQGAQLCESCHASEEYGLTRFYRDFHAAWDLDCTRCHGALADHAISLLKYEAARGSRAAAARLPKVAALTSRQVQDIVPRQPGQNLPHCSGCHDLKVKPDPDAASAFNKWTASQAERFTQALDDSGQLRCPSCHGTPHALYPAEEEIDNLQPMQYQNLAAPLGAGGNCAVCHTVEMDYFIHHERPD